MGPDVSWAFGPIGEALVKPLRAGNQGLGQPAVRPSCDELKANEDPDVPTGSILTSGRLAQKLSSAL